MNNPGESGCKADLSNIGICWADSEEFPYSFQNTHAIDYNGLEENNHGPLHSQN